MKKKNQKTLNQLIKDWDKKLKESGFVDIENRKNFKLKGMGSGGDVYLGNNSIEKLITDQKVIELNNGGLKQGYSSLLWKQSQEEYFRLASQCLHEFDFKSVLERIIWQLHSEGLTFDEISKELNITLDKARRTIERLGTEFGLRPRLK